MSGVSTRTAQRACETCAASLAPAAAYCGGCGQPDHEALLGRTIADRYQIVAFVGAGGMGRVYRARHLGLERDVALKVLAPAYAADRELLARFRREAVATSRLAHPNVVGALDFGVADGLTYFVMEWLDGLTLDELLARRGPLPPARALHLALQAASALGAAHAAGVIHRDVKPGNLMVLADDVLKVVDFGLAQLRAADGRLTHEGRTLGTPAYLAPEQVAGEVVTPAADVYALGGVLYELLTGAPPVGHGDALALLTRQLTVAAPPPSTRRPALRALGVDALCAALLAKAPAARPADGLAAAHAIADVLAALTGAPGPAPLTATSRAVLVLDLGLPRDDEADALGRGARATIAAAGGTIARAVGDELFAHFSSSELAVLAAIAVSDQIVGAHGRVAVHHGEVQVGAGGGLFGPTVNHALRIARLTPPGAVVVSAPATAHAGLAVTALLTPHGHIQLGKDPPLALWIAGARAGVDPAIAVRGRAGAGVVEFTCGCGAAGRIATAGDATAWVARCHACSQPWIVLPPAEPVGAPSAAPPSGLVDAVGIDAGSPSADHAILAALANLE